MSGPTALLDQVFLQFGFRTLQYAYPGDGDPRSLSRGILHVRDVSEADARRGIAARHNGSIQPQPQCPSVLGRMAASRGDRPRYAAVSDNAARSEVYSFGLLGRV